MTQPSQHASGQYPVLPLRTEVQLPGHVAPLEVGREAKVVGTPPTVDGVQFARGAKALHVNITGNGASYIRETKTFPIPNDRYWGRMFVYFHKLPTTPSRKSAADASDFPRVLSTLLTCAVYCSGPSI